MDIEQKLDEEIEIYKYLYNGEERSEEEMQVIRNFQRKRLTELEKFKEERKKDELIKELTGDYFEDFYQNNMKDAIEMYSNIGIYYRDKVDKHTAWEIWKAAWKYFLEV